MIRILLIYVLVLPFLESLAQPATSPTTQPADFSGEDTPYHVLGPNGNASAQNKLGTWLYGYTVASYIDWNDAAALEFLGAPGLNIKEQPQIEAVLANVATVIYSNVNPFQHYLKVRCDDPFKRCQNRPDQDPCKPPPDPSVSEAPSPTSQAYSKNEDKDDTAYPMINFCEGCLNDRNLADAVAYGKSFKSPDRYDLRRYDSRAQTFLHELMHLDLAANSPQPNPRVLDVNINIKIGSQGRYLPVKAYGALLPKILARYQGLQGLGTTGYWVQRNAENLANYAYAKYITEALGGIYPHLPLVIQEIKGAPYTGPLDPVFQLVAENGDVYLNATDDIRTLDQVSAVGIDPAYPCSDDLDDPSDPAANSALTINSLAPASAYPDSYNSQVSSWLADLETAASTSSTPTTAFASSIAALSSSNALPLSAPTTTTSSVAAASAPYATGQCSFHLQETQDCDPDSQNLFAIVNLKDAAGNDIGDTSVDPAKNPRGQGINDGSPYDFDSLLPYVLIITGEHTNDYIQFNYGGINWGSSTPNDGAYCNVGGWDPRDGPLCDPDYQFQDANRNMDCYFPC